MKTLFLILLTALLISGCERQKPSEMKHEESRPAASRETESDRTSPPLSSQGLPVSRFNFTGMSPKEVMVRASLTAQEWNAKASLQAILANRWELYGDPATGRVTGMEVPEWRFVFLAEDRIGSFIVTHDAVRLLKDESKPRSPSADSPISGPPLADWRIDAADALNAALKAGIAISQGPWLWMRSVGGKAEPVWTILTESGSFFVSANTGCIIRGDELGEQ